MDVKAKAITQHCIKSHFFDEVMNLPKEVTIVSLQVEVGFAIKRLSQQIPTILAGAGVIAIRKSDPSVEVDARFTGSRTSMKKSCKTICEELGLRQNSVRVKRMVVSTNGGKNEGTFVRQTKMLHDGDKLKRNVVLGLVRWDGDENTIAQACRTIPYKCKFDVQTIRTVICEEG